MKFVDISGFGNSGKSVLTDLFREFNGFNVPDYNFEFNLIRIQDGLIDLKSNLVDNWSPIRSTSAIYRFKKLISKIGPTATIWQPKTLFISNGMNYDLFFKNQFTTISNQYINSLISLQYKADWPFQSIDNTSIDQFLTRIKNKIKIFKNKESEIFLTSINEIDFFKKTQEYINSLYSTISRKNDKYFITHNACEPFNTDLNINFFTNGKAIIVKRDPRDIYANTLISEKGFIPEFETKNQWKSKKSFLSTNNVEVFCSRQKIFYEHVSILNSRNVLSLFYEDIVLNYESVLIEIYKFLGESSDIHVDKRKYFDPEKSKNNIGLWHKLDNSEEIKIIEKQLNRFLYKNGKVSEY